jgi:ATP-binding cassette subfamily F protein 3
VLHISGHAKRLTQQRGSYTTWAKRRAEQQATWARKSKDRADQRAKMYERANCGFRFGGSDMNKQQQLLKQIERSDLEKEREDDELAALNEDEELPLKLCAGGQLNKPAVMIKGVRFNYPGGKTLFSDVEMRIEATRQSRIVLMGENGNGKTTLVRRMMPASSEVAVDLCCCRCVQRCVASEHVCCRLGLLTAPHHYRQVTILMGKLDPVSGLVERESGARIEVVNQHHADQIDLSLTPLAFLKSKFPGDGSNAHDLKLRSHLAGCGETWRLRYRVFGMVSLDKSDSRVRIDISRQGCRPS